MPAQWSYHNPGHSTGFSQCHNPFGSRSHQHSGNRKKLWDRNTVIFKGKTSGNISFEPAAGDLLGEKRSEGGGEGQRNGITGSQEAHPTKP